MNSRKLKSLPALVKGMKACHNHRISSVQIYATNRCNSRCRICYIWDEKPKADLSVEAIKSIINSKKVEKSALYALLGGEFILHPNYKEMLTLFKNKNYILFSNCILDKKLIETVKEFKVPNLFVSLDGSKESYMNVRGVDKYDNVINVIKKTKDLTNITITYVINPYNTKEDFLHVKRIADKHKVGLVVAVYDTRSIYNAKTSKNSLYEVNDIFENNYLKSYKLWRDGKLRLPCYSIRTLLTVMPNGNIPLCQQKNIILGNIYKNNIDSIWEKSKDVQLKHTDCNGCWITCHRSFDNNVCKFMHTFLLEPVLNRFVGKYDWKQVGKIF